MAAKKARFRARFILNMIVTVPIPNAETFAEAHDMALKVDGKHLLASDVEWDDGGFSVITLDDLQAWKAFEA